MAYILPQVLVFQEFDVVPTALITQLRAHISGPHAFLLRYADPNEKLLAYVGAYDPLNDLVAGWPQRPPGGVIDQSYTKVYIDKAMLQYFVKKIGVDLPASGDAAGAVTVVPTAANQINLKGSIYGFEANGASYPRHPALYDRDVQPGDRVHIRGVVSSTSYTIDSYVTAILADPIGATVDPVTEDSPPTNGQTQTASAVVTGLGTPPPTIMPTASTTNYSALADGVLVDTYTVTVINSSVGGDLTTASLRITTASGYDDVAAVSPAASGTSFPVGRRGLALTFTTTGGTNLLAGEAWEIEVNDDYTTITAVSGGVYRGTQSTTYVIEFSRGGTISDDLTACPQFRAITIHGTDSSQPLPVTTSTLGSPYPVGTQGVTILFTAGAGIRKGDRFYIQVLAAQDGRMSTLVLGNNLPAQLWTPTPATDLDLTLSVERNIMVDETVDGITNWEQEDTQVIIHGGVEAYDETFTAGGEPRPLPVESGLVYLEYRAWIPDLASQVGTIFDVGDLDTMIPGPLSPDNPLKWGVYKALANANGTEVKFTAIANPDDIDSWVACLSLLIGRDDVYNLVPLTFDRNIIDLYAAHVQDESAAEQAHWRAVFCSIKANSQDAVVSDATSADGTVVMAEIADNPNASGNQFTLLTVPAGNSNFLANLVRPGDVVRTNYGIDSGGNEIFDEYVIDEVLNEDSLLLMAGPDQPVTVAQKMEVWRFLNKDEIAQDLAQQAGSFSSRRVKAVWPDVVGSGGILQEGYYLAAALAGLRSGVVPHQGLTNVAVAGFDDLTRTTNFLGGAQLNTMAGAGTWIVTQAPDGTVYNRHALTTDNTDVNSSEEMVTSNLDSISYLFQQRLAIYIGRMNVTPTALLVLGTEIESCIDFLKSNGYVPRLGAQLVDATIITLQKHAILADRVVCVIDVTLPYPMNNLEIHLVV
jgi:hypothetical protein